MRSDESSSQILKILLKDFSIRQTITSISNTMKLSRVGIWKAIKRLESENLIQISKIGEGLTSTYTLALNFDNPLLEKRLSLELAKDALENKRWMDNFKELENKIEFLLLYGSIISNPKNANDIDVLGMVEDRKKFIEIEKAITIIQKTQVKKIHAITLTPAELENELNIKNPAYIDAIKKGIILFGQEKFIKFMQPIISKWH